jgi:hypothetical protein
MPESLLLLLLLLLQQQLLMLLLLKVETAQCSLRTKGPFPHRPPS